MAPRPTKTKAAKAAPTDNPRESEAGPADGTLPSAGRGEAGEPNSEARAAGSAKGQIAQPEPDAGAQAAKAGGPETPPADAAETGESKGEDAAASPELDMKTAPADGVEKTALPMMLDTIAELAVAEISAAIPAPFDPVAFVSGLSEEELVVLANFLKRRAAAPLLVGSAGGEVRIADIGEPLHLFEISSRLKKSGRYFEPGAELLLTRKEHGELKAAGVVSADWPD